MKHFLLLLLFKIFQLLSLKSNSYRNISSLLQDAMDI